MPASYEEIQELVKQFAYKKEMSEWEPVPLDQFSREHLERLLEGNMLSTLAALGLVHRAQTPNVAAIKTFMRHKARYFDDDIPHVKMFPHQSAVSAVDAAEQTPSGDEGRGATEGELGARDAV